VDCLSDKVAHAYLEHLDVDARPGEVDPVGLAALVRAHLRRIPYENVDIVRGRPPGIEPLACVDRVLSGRGGYCYHLNGALATLLEWLQVDVTRHVAGVQRRTDDVPPGPNGSHLGVTARTTDGTEWLVDAGFGDGPAEPLPLAFGRYERDGFTYELRRSSFDPGGWRFEHGPHGSFLGADFSRAPAASADFVGMHVTLSTAPDSKFVRLVSVIRHFEGGIESLRGCVHSRITPTSVERHDVESESEWWDVVIDGFGLAYSDVTAAERAQLWRRVRGSHEAWDAAGRP
jgi:arylamine N-acetyltransferase